MALHLLYELWISSVLATGVTGETCVVEVRVWCRRVGTVNFIKQIKEEFNINNTPISAKGVERDALLEIWKLENWYKISSL